MTSSKFSSEISKNLTEYLYSLTRAQMHNLQGKSDDLSLIVIVIEQIDDFPSPSTKQVFEKGNENKKLCDQNMSQNNIPDENYNYTNKRTRGTRLGA